ncbi:MAG: class I SAM-dependent methyltransferase, partial [Okeania sp. SIO2D1]|nr:class I SAM-dependent methyltransferase [Okeania sp. SIO2D1]
MYLANQTNCEVVGIDISQTHVDNAKEKAESFPNLNLSFEKASATNLTFPDNYFTHVWSQGTLLHIHEREVALKEFYRLLDRGGILIFDDLVTLVSQVSESTLKYVYERMHLSQLFSPNSYRN